MIVPSAPFLTASRLARSFSRSLVTIGSSSLSGGGCPGLPSTEAPGRDGRAASRWLRDLLRVDRAGTEKIRFEFSWYSSPSLKDSYLEFVDVEDNRSSTLETVSLEHEAKMRYAPVHVFNQRKTSTRGKMVVDGRTRSSLACLVSTRSLVRLPSTIINAGLASTSSSRFHPWVLRSSATLEVGRCPSS